MSKEARDAVIVASWENAYARAGCARLTGEQRDELVYEVSRNCELSDLDFHALQMRVQRIRERGTLVRAPGSGRPRKFTEEHAEAAREIARRFGGDISRTGIFEVVAERFGPENVNKRAQFLNWLSEIFKRRRIRYKPTLNESQMSLRVEYAKHSVETYFSDEERTIFADEKRFEANSSGVYNLPIEDASPIRRIQSRSNPVFVMVLLVIAAPRNGWNGVIAMHSFTERVAAQKRSKNREAGTLELKAVNVTKESYVAAWVDSIIPAILVAISERKLPPPTANRPLLLQDDNASPHRDAFKDGLTVPQYICREARVLGLFLVPKAPQQPAQSPDLNPLDTFVFRMLSLKWRRLRARDRVVQMAKHGERARGDPEEPPQAQRRLDFVAYSGSDEDEEPYNMQTVVLLRCKPQGVRKNALCTGCGVLVRQNDKTAVQCELRFGWWHFECVKALIGKELYVRAVLPDLRSDDIWICPQCSMHLCRNDDRSAHLCLVCWLPSQRNGADNMGTDMISCDSDCGGLFHRKCANYDEEVAVDTDHWYCAACDTLINDQYVGLEEIEARPISGNNVQALERAVQYALHEVSQESFERGFQTRREIIKKVLSCAGKNDYNMHWRRQAKKK
jgi:transposase